VSEEKELPQGWAECELGELTSDISYGYTAKASKQPVGPRMLRITDIQDNRVDWDSVPFCKISEHEKVKYVLKNRDLVFARTGATVGKSYLISGDIPESVYASYLIRVRCSIEPMAGYLKHYFRSRDYWDQITDFSAGIGQPNVNGSKLKRLNIPLAPLNEQKRIADKLDTVLARVDSCRERLERVPAILKRFRQSVLAAAISGTLTEEWRAANPHLVDAADLAAQIQIAHKEAGGHRAGNAAPPTDDVHDLSTEMFPQGWELLTLRDVVQPDRPITYGILKPGPEVDDGVPYVRVAD